MKRDENKMCFLYEILATDPPTQFTSVSFTKKYPGESTTETNLLNLTPGENFTHYFRTTYYVSPNDDWITSSGVAIEPNTLLALESQGKLYH